MSQPISEHDLASLEARAGVPFDPVLRAFLSNPMGVLLQEQVCVDRDCDVFLFGLLAPSGHPSLRCMDVWHDVNGQMIVGLFENSSQYAIGATVNARSIGPEIVVCAIDEEEGLRMVEFASLTDMETAVTQLLPYSDGCCAYDEGRGLDTNPHPEGTPAFDLWREGWTKFQEEDQG